MSGVKLSGRTSSACVRASAVRVPAPRHGQCGVRVVRGGAVCVSVCVCVCVRERERVCVCQCVCV